MSARKPSDGTWNHQGIEFKLRRGQIVYARFKDGPKKARRRHVISPRYYGSVAECVAYKANQKLEIERPTANSRITFEKAREEFLRKPRKLGTKRAYSYRLNTEAIKLLDRKTVMSIHDGHLLAVVQRMELKAEEKGTTLYCSTLSSNLIPLQAFFRWAIKKGYHRGPNPVSLLTISELATPSPKRRPPEYTEQDIARLFETLDHTFYGLFGLAYYTGARISELLGLQWKHIHDEDPADTYIDFASQRDPVTAEQLGYTKTESEDEAVGRLVDLPEQAFPFVKAQRVLCGLNRRPEDPVFPDLRQYDVQRYIAGYDKDGKHYEGLRDRLGPPFDGSTGQRPFTLHKLRNNYASVAIAAGADETDIADQLGHSVRELRSTYRHKLRHRRDRTRTAAYAMNRPIAGAR